MVDLSIAMLNYQRLYSYNIHPIPCSYGHSGKIPRFTGPKDVVSFLTKNSGFLGCLMLGERALILFLRYKGILMEF